MIRVSIGLEWSITAPQGNPLGMKVVDLLVKVEEQGSLAQACAVCGVSYRYAWTLIREAEKVLGQPVLTMSRGRGSALTVLGARLVWAHRRIQARLTPLLDSLASEVGAEIERVVSPQPSQLRIHASHGFAVQLLHVALNRQGVAHELKYCGTAEALESLAQGECDVAGFHVPIGEFAQVVTDHFGPALDDTDFKTAETALSIGNTDIKLLKAGSTAEVNPAFSRPSRPIRYLWKFQRGASCGRSSAAQR